MKQLCMKCGKGLTGDEIAIYRKLVLREAREYLCLDCLAERLGVSREWLQSRIDFFHRTGLCSLFARTGEEG